jgi:hypothetical protein
VESSEVQKRLRQAKDSERKLAKWLIANDGPDPVMKPGNGIVSETGRVGHVTALQFDAISLHYAAENKHEKVPSTWWTYWLKIVQRADEWRKTPLLRIEPTNEDRTISGRRIPTMHLITEDRHKELLDYERLYLSQTEQPKGIGYSKEQQAGRSKRKK